MTQTKLLTRRDETQDDAREERRVCVRRGARTWRSETHERVGGSNPVRPGRFIHVSYRLVSIRLYAASLASSRGSLLLRLRLLRLARREHPDRVPSKCGEHVLHSHPIAQAFPLVLSPPNSMVSTKLMYGLGPSLLRPIFAVPSMTMSSSACEKGYERNIPAKPFSPYAVAARDSALKASPAAELGTRERTEARSGSAPAAPAAEGRQRPTRTRPTPP